MFGMTERPVGPGLGPGEERPRRSEFYECTHCRSTFDEWAEDCPDCGQLVVRVVDRSG